MEVVEVRLEELGRLDARDSLDRWLRAVSASGLSASAQGPPGSPQAHMAALYETLHALHEVEGQLQVHRGEDELVYPAHPAMWVIPPALMVLAFVLGARQEVDTDKLMTAARVLMGGGAVAIAGLLLLRLQRARRSLVHQTLGEEAKAQKAALLTEVVAARDALRSGSWICEVRGRLLVFRGEGAPRSWDREGPTSGPEYDAAWAGPEDLQ